MKLIELVNTCTDCPSQWEGKLEDGRNIYCRYRWSYLTIEVSEEPGGEAIGRGNGNLIYSYEKKVGGKIDGWDGSMDTSELYEHLMKAGIAIALK